MPRVRFKPLIISKRRWQGPWFPSYNISDSDADYESLPFDSEKQDASEWEDASHASTSANSSRVSSGAYDQQDSLLDRRKRPKKPASAYGPRKDFNIYFTVILGAVLVAFVLTLVSLQKRSAAEVSSGLHKPEPKPPPWHEFTRLERYWGGLKSLVAENEWIPEYPGEEKAVREEAVEALEEASTDSGDRIRRRSAAPQARSKGRATSQVECFLDEEKRIKVPQLRSYEGLPQGFPGHIMGISDVLKSNNTQCLDRYRRFGPYGFGYSRSLGGTGAGVGATLDDGEDLRKREPEIDYSDIMWSKAQNRCAAANAHRFQASDPVTTTKSPPASMPRTAVVIHSDSNHEFGAEENLQLRALISEAALATGGLYAVHFLIRVGNDKPDIWSDKEEYEGIVNASLPTEFHGMGALWSKEQMQMVYGDIADASDTLYSAGRGAYLPLQHFAHQHAEYEHFWVWDVNARYTGQIGELFTQIHKWTEGQPRKEIWERSARFYVPTEHASWNEFSQMVHVLAEHGPPDPFRDATDDSMSSKPVWGPQPADDSSDPSLFINPPSSPSSDNYNWGVAEAADFVSLSPIFNPGHVTSFPPAGDVTGYNATAPQLPRRATTSGIVRLSRRLLLAMDAESVQRSRHMAPELWPASVALHYGYKAVYAPHTTYVDRKWPTDYLAAVMNTGADGGVVSGRSSVFGDPHRGVFEGLSWGATAGQKSFGRSLWRRWLGYRDEETGEGGEEWEDANEGRMCLPPMLLGGVGRIDLVVEQDESAD